VTGAYLHTVALMGTVCTFHVVGHEDEHSERIAAVERAVAWFELVEGICSRFVATSEVQKLAGTSGVAVPVSELLFGAVEFALTVAEETGGAFDPTVGLAMEARGFDREYRTGAVVRTPLVPNDGVSYRDVTLDPKRQAITLERPLLLDLGAVAKGLAIDMAARELAPFENFAIDAGGDLYFGGHNASGEPWSVGVRHPRDADALIETLRVTDTAVCTSGDYERHTPSGHHVLDPRTREPAQEIASVTVIAPIAMVADALSTAAFVLGPSAGVRLLEDQGVQGLIVTPTLERFATSGLGAYA
jgi:FAD:protein FMN transferase